MTVHTMSSYIPTVGGSGLLIQNAYVPEPLPVNVKVGTWTADLLQPNTGSRTFSQSTYGQTTNGVIFGTSNYLTINSISYNMFSGLDTPLPPPESWNTNYGLAPNRFHGQWDMVNPVSQTSIYRLIPSSLSAIGTARKYAYVSTDTDNVEQRYNVGRVYVSFGLCNKQNINNSAVYSESRTYNAEANYGDTTWHASSDSAFSKIYSGSASQVEAVYVSVEASTTLGSPYIANIQGGVYSILTATNSGNSASASEMRLYASGGIYRIANPY